MIKMYTSLDKQYKNENIYSNKDKIFNVPSSVIPSTTQIYIPGNKRIAFTNSGKVEFNAATHAANEVTVDTLDGPLSTSGCVSVPRTTYIADSQYGLKFTNVSLGSAEYTLEGWFKRTSDLNQYDTIDICGFRKSAVSGRITGQPMFGSFSSTNRHWVHSGSVSAILGNPFTLNTWVHIAYVRTTNGQVKCFVDGSLVATGSSYTGDKSEWDIVYIGTIVYSSGTNGDSFKFAHFHISQTALYSANFTPKLSALF